MIVWINCKITDQRLGKYTRYHLRDDNRFDIAKYSFASFATLAPVVSKFIFNLTFADGFAGREAEMEEWLKSIFPEDKLELTWARRDRISEWEDLFNDNQDDLYFVAGQEDHIFMDSDLATIQKGIKIMTEDRDKKSALMMTHYPEAMRGAAVFDTKYVDDWVAYPRQIGDSMIIIHRELFADYITHVKNNDANRTVFRLEDLPSAGLHMTYNVYASTKEQFHHFDGYSHVGIGPEIAPPLEIPPKFFEGEMVIRYGFNDRDENCVNINPFSKLYAGDATGADYKFSLEDIPIFWKSRIKEIIVAEGFDVEAAKKARDEYFLSKTNLEIPNFWPHYGTPRPLPREWFKNVFIT
jgi:hypothetical protein